MTKKKKQEIKLNGNLGIGSTNTRIRHFGGDPKRLERVRKRNKSKVWSTLHKVYKELDKNE